MYDSLVGVKKFLIEGSFDEGCIGEHSVEGEVCMGFDNWVFVDRGFWVVELLFAAFEAAHKVVHSSLHTVWGQA